MGISAYECAVCSAAGGRCARVDGTDPAYPQGDEPASARCAPTCRGGQSCFERRTVCVPVALLAARAGAPLPAELKAHYLTAYDGYHHYCEEADEAAGGASALAVLTSGAMLVPPPRLWFTPETGMAARDAAALLAERRTRSELPGLPPGGDALQYVVGVTVYCRSCWVASQAGGSTEATGGGSSSSSSSGAAAAAASPVASSAAGASRKRSADELEGGGGSAASAAAAPPPAKRATLTMDLAEPRLAAELQLPGSRDATSYRQLKVEDALGYLDKVSAARATNGLLRRRGRDALHHFNANVPSPLP